MVVDHFLEGCSYAILFVFVVVFIIVLMKPDNALVIFVSQSLPAVDICDAICDESCNNSYAMSDVTLVESL
jgi:hypothetical protein